MRTMVEASDDLYLRTLRSANYSLESLGALASGRGDHALANRLWAISAEIRRERTRARAAGMRYFGSLGPEHEVEVNE